MLLEWLLGAHAAHSVLRNRLENSVSQTGLITALSGLPLSSCCSVVMSMITFLGHNSIMTLPFYVILSCTSPRFTLFLHKKEKKIVYLWIYCKVTQVIYLMISGVSVLELGQIVD